MSIEEYTEKMKGIQTAILEFLENEDDSNENFINLNNIIDEQKIYADKHKFTLFLHIISSISKNHYRSPDFISKIEKILSNYAEIIKKNLTNFQIFDIFKGNKRIILSLLEKQILFMDEEIVDKITSNKYFKANYPHYFLPEIKEFEDEIQYKYDDNHYLFYKEPRQLFEKELPENFYELRKEGENENYICKLIRNDSIEEFIAYINRHNYSLESEINPSIYETNSFLIQKQIESKKSDNISSIYNKKNQNNKMTLIDYAAFFGSIQILKYLQLNGVNLTPQLWIYSIHGKNAEIINLLEENGIEPKYENKNYRYWGFESNKSDDFEVNIYKDCLNESIKCHHNDIANYLIDNYFEIINSNNYSIESLKSYNFQFIQSESINENTFISLIKYNYYYYLTRLILTNKNIDVNKILNYIIQYNFKSYVFV